MEKEFKNTNPKFYKNWSKELLIQELCRINQLIIDCLELVNKIRKDAKDS